MTSKAEKWAAIKPENFSTDRVQADVDAGGRFARVQVGREDFYIGANDALALAAWINETFGEDLE